MPGRSSPPAWRELAEVVKQRVDQRAAVALVVGAAGAGVDHHAGGFVDDGEVLVLEEDVEGDVLGKAWSGVGRGSPSISMASPPASFCFGFAGLPFTRTWPDSISSWTRAREMSGRPARDTGPAAARRRQGLR